jgi:hypothetical protein
MTSTRFNPEKDIAPMPFDKEICHRALDMKKNGLIWQPHVGCFVWARMNSSNPPPLIDRWDEALFL